MTTEHRGIDKTMIKIVENIYEKHSVHKWDTVWAVVGDEGTGKSNFAMQILHKWLMLKNGEVLESDVKHMCMDREMWATDIKDAEKLECTVYDETDLYSRRSMGGFNVKINKAYQVIRADNLFTVLVLPSLWDLDTFFRNRRLRGLVYVNKRGRYCFWSKTRLRRMVAVNSKYPYKNYFVVKPTHRGWFAEYKGVFARAYKDMKNKKMLKLRTDLHKELVGKNTNPIKEAVSKLLKDTTLDATQIGKAFGVSRATVYNYSKEVNKSNVK